LFFSALRNEPVRRNVHATKVETKRDVVRLPKGFYNNLFRHSAHGYPGQRRPPGSMPASVSSKRNQPKLLSKNPAARHSAIVGGISASQHVLQKFEGFVYL